MIGNAYRWVAVSQKRQWAVAVIVGIPLIVLGSEVAQALGYWSTQPIR